MMVLLADSTLPAVIVLGIGLGVVMLAAAGISYVSSSIKGAILGE